jgi:hypothetical protein
MTHLGGLTRVGPYADRDDEVLATWRRGLAAVVACPNVYLKLGVSACPAWGLTGMNGRNRSVRTSWPRQWRRS